MERDQVEDYPRRKGMDLRQVERWLRPGLNYDPELEDASRLSQEVRCRNLGFRDGSVLVLGLMSAI